MSGYRHQVLTNILALWLLGSAAPASAQKDCSATSVGFVPVSDLGAGNYFDEEGGLYAGGVNQPPAFHHSAGVVRGERIEPLDTWGLPSEGGVVLWISIGMSNTRNEAQQFVARYDNFANINPRFRALNCAQGGMDAKKIRDPDSVYWDNVRTTLTSNGYSAAQVQVIWLKEANASPSGSFPSDANLLRANLTDIVHILHDLFPNLKICHLSSRIYAGYATGGLNPEPYAYESAFAVKWVIDDQITGSPALNYGQVDGQPVNSPWLAWGPYLWADGLTPRSDGLVWQCTEYLDDGVHPNTAGSRKVADMLIDFYAADPACRPWFLACRADWNGDGAVDAFDYDDFVSDYFEHLAGGGGYPDYNADGVVDAFDYDDFVSGYFGGCG